MNLFHAVILGIVEGITEFLPVSSTGHLILTTRLLGIPPTEFMKTFEIAIQSGAILAVLFLYGRSLFTNAETAKRVAAAFFPTAVIGFMLYKIIKKYLLGNAAVVLWALFIGGIILIVFELFRPKREELDGGMNQISYRQSFLIGVCQSLAVIPGVSRSAATIVGGLALGIPRRTLVEFSFLLAVPTLLAATGLDLLKSGFAFSGNELFFLAVGATVSFAVAVAAIRLFLSFIGRHSFMAFGVYRVAAALVLWAVITR